MLGKGLVCGVSGGWVLAELLASSHRWWKGGEELSSLTVAKAAQWGPSSLCMQVRQGWGTGETYP